MSSAYGLSSRTGELTESSIRREEIFTAGCAEFLTHRGRKTAKVSNPYFRLMLFFPGRGQFLLASADYVLSDMRRDDFVM